jgi:tRNA-(ms[2]io[6]A)-hydroxylase
MSAALPQLAAPTPAAWVEAACREWQLLLLDHANCEKKAASTAIAMMFAYADDRPLAARLSRLAREELRHFELVDRLLQRLGVPARKLAPGRYAARLLSQLAAHEPLRKLDQLLACALIEARSCERFALLRVDLPPQIAALYGALEESEARHADMYIELAQQHAARSGIEDWRLRLAALAAHEGRLATEPDGLFRFHSGPPPAPAGVVAAAAEVLL